MNDWERAICSRVKTVRESVEWSQATFARQLGISRNQLASIECGRTPVRYEIAWKLRRSFEISLRWLEEGFGFADKPENDNLPVPHATGLPKRALLSTVAQKFYGDENLVSIGPNKDSEKGKIEYDPNSTEDLFRAVTECLEGREAATGIEDIGNRALLESQIKIMLESWMARVPVGHAYEFTEKLTQFAEQFIHSFPAEALKIIDQRSEKIMWERIKNANAKRVLVAADLGKTLTESKKDLTNVVLSVNIQGVKEQLPALRKRLNEATRERGTKTTLAKFMGVKLPTISRWLSGEKEPGGETTLQLLKWVEQQERQK